GKQERGRRLRDDHCDADAPGNAGVLRVHRRKEERTAEDAEDAGEERERETFARRSSRRSGAPASSSPASCRTGETVFATGDALGSAGVLAGIRLKPGQSQRQDR